MDMVSINKMVDVIHQQFTILVIDMILALIIMLLLKIIAEHVAGHIMFRMDKHTSIGSPVEVYGKRGRIKEVSLFNITIETECGYIRIPTKHWKASKYILLKGEPVLRNNSAGRTQECGGNENAPEQTPPQQTV